jgi:hypothetical protein
VMAHLPRAEGSGEVVSRVARRVGAARHEMQSRRLSSLRLPRPGRRPSADPPVSGVYNLELHSQPPNVPEPVASPSFLTRSSCSWSTAAFASSPPFSSWCWAGCSPPGPSAGPWRLLPPAARSHAEAAARLAGALLRSDPDRRPRARTVRPCRRRASSPCSAPPALRSGSRSRARSPTSPPAS